MARLAAKTTLALAAILATLASPLLADPVSPNTGSNGQKFQYGPYGSQNNPESEGQAFPQDDAGPGDASRGDAYVPPSNGGGGARPPADDRNAASSYRDDARDDGGFDADDGDDSAGAPPSDADGPPIGNEQEPPPRDAAGPPPGDYDGGLPRVEVRTSAPDSNVPYEIRKHDARHAAIQAWRSKVADRFGPQFAHWRMAAGKHVDCMPDRREGLVCIASALPVRGFGRYGHRRREGRY